MGGVRRPAPRPDRGQRRRAHFIDRFFPGDYKVIPNGVDVDRFQRAVPIARWQDGTKNILFVGRFEPRKGLLDLLKAYRILRKTGCDCRLLVVGGGPQDKEARRYLATRKLGGVEFLGRVSDDERDALFKTADVYFSPATGGESFGIVLLEAMAAGHGDRRAATSTATRASSGAAARPCSCRPREPKAIAGALARLLRDDELRERDGPRPAASGPQEFSWERVTAKVEDYYGFVIRRLAARGELPAGFHAADPALAARRRPRRCRRPSRSRRARRADAVETAAPASSRAAVRLPASPAGAAGDPPSAAGRGVGSSASRSASAIRQTQAV